MQIREQLERDIAEAAAMSTAYARMIIGNGFLLNGGALIALPAFQSEHLRGVLAGNGWVIPLLFVIGLLCAAATATLAHLQAKRALVALKLVAAGHRERAANFSKGDRFLVNAMWVLGLMIYVSFFTSSFFLVQRVSALHG
jgi:hypothetical protein